MKRLLAPCVASVLAALGLLLSGCGGSSASKIDTAELTQAFASADASLKKPAEDAGKLLLAGKLLEGTTGLVKLAKDGGEKLTEPQKNALINLCASVQMVMSEDAAKVDEKVHQAVEDLMAALEGRDSGKIGINPDMPAAKKPAGQ
jgi:hypothetical protein